MIKHQSYDTSRNGNLAAGCLNIAQLENVHCARTCCLMINIGCTLAHVPPASSIILHSISQSSSPTLRHVWCHEGTANSELDCPDLGRPKARRWRLPTRQPAQRCRHSSRARAMPRLRQAWNSVAAGALRYCKQASHRSRLSG